MNNPGTTGIGRTLTLEKAEMLLIVPPVAKLNIPSLAVHTLQALCRSHQVSTSTFYANIDFARTIGVKRYDTIADLEEIVFLGERIFASHAYGLPPMGRNLHRLLDRHWLPDHLWQNRNDEATEKMAQTFAPIKQWVLSVDWESLVAETGQWLDAVAEHIAGGSYQIVGCSNTLGGLAPSIALLDRIKQHNRQIVTVLGGALCEGEMAEGIASLQKGIDYIFSGESDQTFPDFVKEVIAGKHPGQSIIYGNDSTDLDHIPRPDYRDYFNQVEPVSDEFSTEHSHKIQLPYETSRGCRMKRCSFCGLNGGRKNYRKRSPKVVKEQLKAISQQYPGISIQMSDNMMPVEYVETLFPDLSHQIPGLDIHYEVTSHLSFSQMRKMKAAGVKRVMPGIESLSSGILKLICKSVSFGQNIAFLRHARSLGIDVCWHLLFGMPNDQEEYYSEMLQLLPLIRHFQPPVRLNSIEIPRFSRYHEEPAHFGITDLKPAQIYEDILPSQGDTHKISYYFAGNFRAASYEHPELIARFRQEFQAWVNSWNTGTENNKTKKPPTLHLTHQSHDQYLLQDTRGLPQAPEKAIISQSQAQVLFYQGPNPNTPETNWAIKQRYAIIQDNIFIPLTTADETLTAHFQTQNHVNPNNTTSQDDHAVQ